MHAQFKLIKTNFGRYIVLFLFIKKSHPNISRNVIYIIILTDACVCVCDCVQNFLLSDELITKVVVALGNKNMFDHKSSFNQMVNIFSSTEL